MSSTVNILCAGDVVGSAGRGVLRAAMPKLIREHDLHCVIANVENAAGGSGLTAQLYQKFCNYGVHLMTLGDHIYRRRDIIPVLETESNIVRPANFPKQAPGKELAVYETASGAKVAVLSVMGRMYMKTPVNCPFEAVDRVLLGVPGDVKIVIVDMHAEATSEKIAMGWHLDGRVTALFGTHTHVPTADARVLPGGTGYITDLGMTGPYDSVLGRDKTKVLRSLVSGVPTTFDVAEHDPRVCGIVIRAEARTGRCVSIQRVEASGTDVVDSSF